MATIAIEEMFGQKTTRKIPTYTGVMKMKPADWIGVPNNPRQRDTERRAARAKHLQNPHPTHSRVNLARIPNGDLYKLDGHTRAFLWAKGELAPPSEVFADVWECASVDQVKELYGTFDSRAAVETVTDQVFGAVRDHKTVFKSELLKSQRFAGGMRFATQLLRRDEENIYDIFEYWLPELNLLDPCMPGRRRFHTGAMAAALITLRRYGPQATSFWKTYAAGAGVKIGNEVDAVQALEERLERMRADRQLGGYGNHLRVVCICLSAFDAYRENRNYYNAGNGKGIKSLQDNSLSKWVSQALRTKRAW